MPQKRDIKKFILDNITNHRKDIIHTAIKKFGLSRQAILKHMHVLIKEKQVAVHGKTRDRIYKLRPKVNFTKEISVDANYNVPELLKLFVMPHLSLLPNNICEIVHFSMNAIMNNIKDHSDATKFYYKLFLSHNDLNLIISDNGIGIFQKIFSELEFNSVRVAAIELAKSGLTTDPNSHSGDELNTILHLFDNVKIESAEISLNYDNIVKEWNLGSSKQANGTRIHLKISPYSKRTCLNTFKNLFFLKPNTLSIPISLIKEGESEFLNTRAQANDLLMNIQKYDSVKFDFKNIDLIGPAFADQLIRKTSKISDSIMIDWVNSNDTIDIMLGRALKNNRF